MADRLTELLNLRTTTLLDLDDEGRALVSNDETGSGQLYELAVDGTSRQLTDFGDPTSGRYLKGARNGRTLVISADDGGTERTQLWLLDLDTPQAQPQQLSNDRAHIHTLLDVFDDQVIYATNRRNEVDFDVVARTVSTGAERVLYDRGGWFNELCVSPDGSWIAASRMTLVAASSQMLLIEVSTGAISEITDASTPGNWGDVSWLPDSNALLAGSDSESEFFSVRRYDLASRQWTVVIAEPAANLSAMPAPDGRSWAVLRSVDGADQLSLCPIAHGAPAGSPIEIPLPSQGVASFRSRLVWSPNSTGLGLTFCSPVAPPEAYVWTQATGLQRRSDSNPNSAATLAGLVQPESHLVPSLHGEQVPVFVLRPGNADGSAVLIIHGGPESATVQSWNALAAALSLAGHTVVLPNVRGSSGYGHRWVSLDDVEKRLDSVADLAAIHSWLPSIGLDSTRVALYGGSYGGYMVLAGLTFYPELWAAGVDIVGISSLTTFMQNTSAYRRAYREREYGSLADHRDVLDAASPLPIIDRLRAPLFIIHGVNDPRVPLSEAEQVAAAVRANGAECELLVYGDEGHGLSKRANRLDAYPQAAAFLRRHLSAVAQ